MDSEPTEAKPILASPAREPVSLEYAGTGILRPPSNILRLMSLWTCGIALAGGVGILLVYAMSGWDQLPLFGFFWLGIGGLLTFVGFITGLIYSLSARGRKYPPPSTPRRATVVVLLPLLNVAVAAGCFFGGIWLMGYHARSVIVINDGQTTIDLVTFYSDSFNTSVGPLKPGASRTIHFPDRPSEFLRMYVIVGAERVPYDVSEEMTADPFRGRRYVRLKGLTGYDNRMGP